MENKTENRAKQITKQHIWITKVNLNYLSAVRNNFFSFLHLEVKQDIHSAAFVTVELQKRKKNCQKKKSTFEPVLSTLSCRSPEMTFS